MAENQSDVELIEINIKPKDKFDIIYNLLQFLFSAAILVTSIVGYHKINSFNYNYFVDMEKNWQLGPITEISLRETECLEGEKLIFDEYWPGTNKGKDCGINVVPNSFEINEIEKIEKRSLNTCQLVEANPPISIKFWENKNFCGKRLNEDYLELNIFKNIQSCPNETRSCGIIDSKQNILCLPLTQACPINKVLVVDKDKIPTDFKYVKNDLSENKVLIYTNENNIKGEILHQFRFSEDQPCINFEFFSTLVEPYELEKSFGKSKCPEVKIERKNKISYEKYDNRLTKVDSMSLKAFRESNGIQTVLNKLPYYKFPDDYSSKTISLWEREYIGISIDCREKLLKSEKLVEKIQNFNKSIFTSRWFFILSMCFVILYFSVLLGHLWDFFKTFKIEKYSSNFLLFVFFGILMTCFSVLAYNRINSVSNDFVILIEEACVDELTFPMVSTYIGSYNSCKYFYFTAEILSIILLVINVVYNIFRQILKNKGINNINSYIECECQCNYNFCC